MDARHSGLSISLATGLLLVLAVPAVAQSPLVGRAVRQSAAVRQEAVAHSENFIVFADSPAWAQQVSAAAEAYRRDLAIYWLGQELPAWPQRCPIHVKAGPQFAASGETRYSLLPMTSSPTRAGNWMMSVVGTHERVLDSVLPHEITHTIFATHFAATDKYVPRWADEGSCTTVEHEAEKRKHRAYLQKFVREGRGLAFNRMFRLKEYPVDVLPLYAQGHSAVQFLIDQGGAQEFIKFLETGMLHDDWAGQLQSHYAYASIGEFQLSWNQWLADGSPADIVAYAPKLRQQRATEAAEPVEPIGANVLLASDSAANQAEANVSPNPYRYAIGNTQPTPAQLAAAADQPAPPNGLASDPPALASSGGGSWYQQRLRQVSGQPATPVPAHNTHLSAAPHSTAQAPGMQSNGIQVLDWGNHAPVNGISPSSHVPGTAQAVPAGYHQYRGIGATDPVMPAVLPPAPVLPREPSPSQLRMVGEAPLWR